MSAGFVWNVLNSPSDRAWFHPMGGCLSTGEGNVSSYWGFLTKKTREESVQWLEVQGVSENIRRRGGETDSTARGETGARTGTSGPRTQTQGHDWAGQQHPK